MQKDKPTRETDYEILYKTALPPQEHSGYGKSAKIQSQVQVKQKCVVLLR